MVEATRASDVGCTWRFVADPRPEGGLAGLLSRDFPKVAHLFPGDPRDPSAWARRSLWLADGWVGAHGGAQAAGLHRRELARALAGYLARLGAPERALAEARRIGDPATVVVVTGQQAGFLTGPAYTVYKAATAVRLARQKEAELGRPVVPVFWVASEDHDYEEARVAWALESGRRLTPFALPPGPKLRSVGSLPIPPAAERLVAEFLSLSEAPPDGWAATTVRTTLARSRTLGEWFARQMLELFGEEGLVVLDPMEPGIRRLAAPALARAAEELDRVLAALADGEAAVRALGLRPQMRMAPDDLHLFRYEGGRRLALRREGERATTRAGEWSAALADLPGAIRSEPERFSPGAALRPLVQDWLLPSLAQVVGPGEAAYLPEVRPAYGAIGLEPPLWAPRLATTVVWPEWARAADEEGLALAELASGSLRRERLKARLSELDGVDVEAAFDRAREAVDAVYAELEGRLSGVSPHLAEIGRANRRRVEWQLDYFERKALAHQRRAHRRLWRRWEELGSVLAPGGGPQDRVVNAYALFGRFPRACLARLLFEAPLPPERSFAVLDAGRSPS